MKMDMQTQRRRAISLFITLISLLPLAVFADDLRIKDAEWDREKQKLSVRGVGPRDTTITIMNAGDGSVLGTTTSRDDGDGEWRFRKYGLELPPCRVRAEANGQTHERDVENTKGNCGSGEPPPPPPPPPPAEGTSINSTGDNAPAASPKVDELPFVNTGEYALLAANDLGMHCADLDYQVFSILPPFNVLHSQVIRRGVNGNDPEILDDTNIEVVYSAASSSNDPANGNSTAADRGEPIFKGNFWQTLPGDANPLWYEVYSPLYFGLLQPTDLTTDKGLPVPDSMKLAGNGVEPNCLESGDPRAECHLTQAWMPGHLQPYFANDPQHFDRFDTSFNFFNGLLGGLGLGAVVPETNWFSAEGIPIMPVDDEGRTNSYPLMRIQARDKTTGETLASTDVVLPVASEADCQQCHAETFDCALVNQSYNYAMECTEDALGRQHPEIPGYQVPEVATIDDAPGDTQEQKLLNAAKINILRLHDAKHGTTLDAERKVVCASCHYSPALDLAQLGPTDSAETEQTQHISMSRAMHGHHGNLTSKFVSEATLFPDMPAPNNPIRQEPVTDHLDTYPLAPADSTQTVQEYVLQQSCYSCHPGKRTDCLRGAMAAGGMVCQDCHGDMMNVGDDFSENFPNVAGDMDTTKRIPWAVEPGCQSCHVGDAMSQPANTSGFIYDASNIRLLRAFRSGDSNATPIKAANSRFAENRIVNNQNQTVDLLYRLSKGHGGVMCEGCHGSTHAIWPNENPFANDNVTAIQLQGHEGKIVECSTCHEGDLGNTLDGPHGMHPVGDTSFSDGGHEYVAKSNPDACRACHGVNGEGTVLSVAAADRTLRKEHGTVTVSKGETITCTLCHENEL